jgi:glutathionyl-hydroquinone reductase
MAIEARHFILEKIIETLIFMLGDILFFCQNSLFPILLKLSVIPCEETLCNFQLVTHNLACHLFLYNLTITSFGIGEKCITLGMKICY